MNILFALLLSIPAQYIDSFPLEMQRNTLQSIVRVIDHSDKKGTCGSGIIVNVNGEILVLTSEHVVNPGQNLEIHLFNDKSWPKPVKKIKNLDIEISLKCSTKDLALLKVQGLNHLPVNFNPKAEITKKIMTLGCSLGNAPSFCEDLFLITGKWNSVELLITKNPPCIGRSGGLILSEKGEMLGVCRGYLLPSKKGIYLTLEEINSFLSQQQSFTSR